MRTRAACAGRKALITGGDSGMGRAAAIAFAREGADVAINYLPEEEPDAREVIDLIRQAGRKARAHPRRYPRRGLLPTAGDRPSAALGGLDIVVCNAGRQQSIPRSSTSPTRSSTATMKTNIYAPFWIIRAALPHLEPGSAIIGTTSEQAYDPVARPLRLCADQGRDDELRQVAGQAARPEGHPRQRRGARADLDAASGLGRRQPGQGRDIRGDRAARAAGQPAELAGIYVRLAEDDGSYTTGNIYGAGGGQGQP